MVVNQPSTFASSLYHVVTRYMLLQCWTMYMCCKLIALNCITSCCRLLHCVLLPGIVCTVCNNAASYHTVPSQLTCGIVYCTVFLCHPIFKNLPSELSSSVTCICTLKSITGVATPKVGKRLWDSDARLFTHRQNDIIIGLLGVSLISDCGFR